MTNSNAFPTDINFYSKSLSDVTDVEINFHSFSSECFVYWTCKKTGIRYFSMPKLHGYGLISLVKFYGIAKMIIVTSTYDVELRDNKFVKHSFYLVPTEVQNNTVPAVMNVL